MRIRIRNKNVDHETALQKTMDSTISEESHEIEIVEVNTSEMLKYRSGFTLLRKRLYHEYFRF